MTFDDDTTPPPRRPTAPYGVQPVVLTPDSNISMPLWRFLTVIALVVSGAIGVWTGYSHLQDTLHAQGDRIVAIDAKLAAIDQAKLLEAARAAAQDELRRAKVECKDLRRGSGGGCRIVLGAGKDE